MRVLIVSSSSGSRGGGELFLLSLAKALKRMGVEVGLWMSSDPRMDELAQLYGNTGELLRCEYTNTFARKGRSLAHLLPENAQLRKVAKQWLEFQPDVIHINKQCLEDGLDLVRTAGKLPVAQLITIHITQSAVELKAVCGGLRDWVARRILLQYPHPIWATSENRSVDLQRFLNAPEPAPFVLNGVSVPGLQEIEVLRQQVQAECAEWVNGKHPVVVSVGRIEEQKNPLRFLEIVGQWKQQVPDLVAIWVGDGRLRAEFDAKIAEMNAGSWIHCAGWQDNATRFLALADVYLHPARFEGLPFALLEAMAFGLPCVISPELADDLKDMPPETWIRAEQDPSLWLPLVTNPDHMDKQAKFCRSLAEERFSIDAMAQGYLDLYHDLVAANKV